MKTVAVVLAMSIGLVPVVHAAEPTPQPAPERRVSRTPDRASRTDRLAEPQLAPATAMYARISEVRFDNASLRDCFDWLRDTLGTNLHVDWAALQAVGVDPDKDVTINLRWVSVPRLLRLLLQESGQSDLLTYYVSGNVLMVTTKEKADERIFTRVYPVEDLALRPRKIGRSRMELGGSGSRSGSGGIGFSGSGSGSSGDSIFRDDEDSDSDDEDTDSTRGQEVVDMVRQLTPAEIWDDAGGRARITYFRGQLIVTGPRSVHELIGGPLRD